MNEHQLAISETTFGGLASLGGQDGTAIDRHSTRLGLRMVWCDGMVWWDVVGGVWCGRMEFGEWWKVGEWCGWE